MSSGNKQSAQSSPNVSSSVIQSDINRLSGKEFLSNISQDINGIAAQTSNMFNDFFGTFSSSEHIATATCINMLVTFGFFTLGSKTAKSNEPSPTRKSRGSLTRSPLKGIKPINTRTYSKAGRKPKALCYNFHSCTTGQKVLAEKSPLIRHSSPRKPDDVPRQQGSDKALNSAENQGFLRDVSETSPSPHIGILSRTNRYFLRQLAHQILEGESVGWLKINRCKKLLEDEGNRCLLLNKLNRTLDCKINPSDHLEDVVRIVSQDIRFFFFVSETSMI